jgi:7,8-dihydropterin-6-yl-methyl-4-(beta-D-ribofuranosyl)aminobenzene 5'-phosphate synthase
MSTKTIPLLPVDEVRVTIVMDNSFDFLLPSTSVAKRVRLGPSPFEHLQPRAEHGYSALLTTRQGERTGRVLFDTGVSPDGILRNLDVMEIDPRDFQAVVLSHGHADHANGLGGLANRMGERNLPVLLHPDAYLERKIVLPNGHETLLPPPRKSDLRAAGIEVIEERGPSMLVDGTVLVSGEVARVTDFERGLSTHQALRGGEWQPDPLIHDDQCAIMHVRGKGLVIVTGCGHAGIVNIVRNAQAITGVEAVHAIIGGFHLSGPLFEPIIEPTIAALAGFAPEVLVPGHCTGWKATHAIAAAMPDAFIPTAVGTDFRMVKDAPAGA